LIATKGNSDKLAGLRNREAALRKAIAIEQVRLQKRRDKDRARLATVIGEAMLVEALRVTDFELLLKQTLKRTVKDEKAAKFLAEMGWLL
jgi:hypothetical protein